MLAPRPVDELNLRERSIRNGAVVCLDRADESAMTTMGRASVMKAIVAPRYGLPDVVELRDVDKPTPGDGEVLVRVHAALVTRAGCGLRAADPPLGRLFLGLRRPKHPVLGSEFVGQVETVGKDVTRLNLGDRVFGVSDTFGAHAEYVSVSEEDEARLMPTDMEYPAAASLIEAITALIFFREVASVEAGQRVLINGAGGSVGGTGVQLAKHFGAHVTGVCSTAKVQLVESLGADHVIDYTGEDFATGGPYDVIFDVASTSSFGRSRRALSPRGMYISAGALSAMLPMLWTSVRGGRRARIAATGLMQKPEHLDVLAELFTSGALRPVIDRTYPLAQAADAYRYVEEGHKAGSVVLAV